MKRAIAAGLARAFLAHAMGDKYPTRALEYVLGWMMLVWSARIVWADNMMSASAFQYFLALAPEIVWGVVGVAISGLRIAALVRNGGWKPGPLSRAVGAAVGFNFWFALGCLYTMAVWNGAPDFPMRFDFAVLATAEMFCFAHCVREYAAAKRSVVRGDGR